MKKLIGLFSIVLALSVMGLFMNFTPAPNPGTNNGVTVEIVKNAQWFLITNCGPVSSQSSTQQYKNGVLHMRTTIYQLPAGCPDIPNKTYKNQITPDYYIKYMPSGIVISKTVIN